MSLRFVPEYRFSTYADVTVDFLKSIGVTALILDIDNTLEPYENPEPGEAVLSWFAALANAGIRAAFVSNNHEERLARFNEKLGIPAYPDAKKPFTGKLRLAMEKMGAAKETTLALGDQVFTDAWAAHNAGIRVALVPPIRDKRDLLTRFKRLLERPVMRAYNRRHKGE